MQNIANDSNKEPQVFKTKSIGNGSVTIRDDSRVCAVGGWDGKIRLYSTKSGKSLGTLRYHKTACQILAFARYIPDEIFDEDDLDREEKMKVRRWLLGGGKDGRISVWDLKDLDR